MNYREKILVRTRPHAHSHVAAAQQGALCLEALTGLSRDRCALEWSCLGLLRDQRICQTEICAIRIKSTAPVSVSCQQPHAEPSA
jgi:hypothetical protein